MAELVINGVNTFRRSRILEALEIDGVLYTDNIEERTPGSGVSIASHTKPSTDNSIDLGDPALRWRNIRFGTAVEGYKASGDTYPTIKLDAQNTRIELGVGGTSIPDTFISREASGSVRIANVVIGGGESGVGDSTPNMIDLGVGKTREINAGKIAYQAFSNYLDIVGAGTIPNNRIVNVWNNLYIVGGLTPSLIVNAARVLGGSQRSVEIRTRLASSTVQTNDSPLIDLEATYWDGTQSISRYAAIFHRMTSTAPSSELVLQIAGTDIAVFKDNKQLLIDSIAELTAGAGVTLVNGAILPNNVALMAKDIQANVREILKIDSANYLVLGDLSRDIKLNALANIILPDGVKIAWSDVNLYRGGSNILKTDDIFYAHIIASNRGLFPRVTLTEFGRVVLEAPLADSTNTLRDSPYIVSRARYWNGTSSASRDAFIFHRMLSATPTSEIVLQIAGVDYLRVGDNGIIAHRDILPNADAAINIGSDTLRINNVRAVTVTTGDLVLKNDKTRWRIVEEPDGLYAINEDTGKRYRIMLQEVN